MSSEKVEYVDHPQHYNSHPSGVEAIDICEHMSFSLGNAFKYAYRAGHKWDTVEDMRKAKWYLVREAMFRRKQRPWFGLRALVHKHLSQRLRRDMRAVVHTETRCAPHLHRAIKCMFEAARRPNDPVPVDNAAMEIQKIINSLN
jgi:hypothetical protein